MPGAVIGISMNLGFPGTFARNGDYLAASRAVKSTDAYPIYFGDAVFLNPDSTGGTFSSTQSLVTLQTQGTTASSTTLTITGSATGIAVGQYVIGAGIPNLTTVSVVSGSTVTLSAAATASASGVAITFTSANLVLANFVGWAQREVKSFETYIVPGTNSSPVNAYFAQGTPATAVKRGNGVLNLKVASTTPVAGGQAYLRVALNSAIPAGVIGGIESAADTGASGYNTIALPNVKFWGGNQDANGNIEIEMLIANQV